MVEIGSQPQVICREVGTHFGQPELSWEKAVLLCWTRYQVHSLHLRESWERISWDDWPKHTQKI